MMPAPEQMTPAPEHLNPEARACWARVQSRCRMNGLWMESDAFGLELLAVACVSYLAYARRVHAMRSADADALRAMEVEALERQRIARQWLADFLLIPVNRVRLAVMSAEGLDADIADLCAPFNEKGH